MSVFEYVCVRDTYAYINVQHKQIHPYVHTLTPQCHKKIYPKNDSDDTNQRWDSESKATRSKSIKPPICKGIELKQQI